jgi:ACS family hexuronate transporter-like MFS transporter
VSRSASERFRWVVLAVFVLSTTINYLDRQTLAALAPAIQREFGLSDTQYGLIVSYFSFPYAIVAPFAGLLVDRIGLNRAVTLAVGVWSCAGIATGFTSGLGGMIACRALLGIAEAAGIPSAGKAIVTYAKAGERAVGHAMNQAAVSLGMILAPPLATFIWLRYGWRPAFVVTGVLGLLWIPLWRAIGHQEPQAAGPATGIEPYRDRRLWAFVAANALNGILYSLWTNWTTKYLATVFGLDLAAANRYAWIPPVFAMAGGFACGWASLRLTLRGIPVVAARYRVCVACGVLALATLAIPLAGSPAWAAAGISLSICAVAGFSVNLYALPLDTFGASHAAFAVSMLVASYGGVQALISGAIGWTRDHYGYAPVTTLAAFTTLLACAVLRAARAER